MKGKIALEEHYESPQFPATGSHEFVDETYFAEVAKNLQNADLRLAMMDRNGIEISILSLTQPGIEQITGPRKAIEMAERMNDYAAEKYLVKHPDRFHVFAALPLQDPNAAAKELERAVKDLGFAGALINGYSNIGDENTAQYLDEPQVLPFWRIVSKLNVPVYLHPRIPLPNQQRIYEGYPGILGSACGFGIETANHAVRLILSGLFDELPNLNVILGHCGEGLPFLLPRLDHRLRHQARGSHGKHKLPPTEYLRKNFFLTTAGIFRTQTLLNTLLEVGGDRILFSVDTPYESIDEIASWFDSCPISDNDRQRIGRDNSFKLFNLDVKWTPKVAVPAQ
jgi:gamma-resorcylate decarboxylase